ncbi:MAG: tRNA (guanosine(37)-N1)-methyltransferase TrmD [Candidatus Neomarinimicrobiota bacterium]|nr:tRNA (guanosine(37)-N1)-methyltransferase TrmD [Candidatus Neomarinimicrobiota bacterium]
MKQKIIIITPVPEMIQSFLSHTMARKAIELDIVDLQIFNLRDYSNGKYRQIDDTPFGGGPGMVMMAKPLFKALDDAIDKLDGIEGLNVLFPSPQGKIWNQKIAQDYTKVEKLVVICGHYKGIDQRVIDKYVTDEYSIGDFVMSCGEIPAMMMIDSIVRLQPGVLNDSESSKTDTFSSELLDTPFYTQPREIKGMRVPKVLLSGNHGLIKSWKENQRIEVTKLKRPDIWKKYNNNLE